MRFPIVCMALLLKGTISKIRQRVMFENRNNWSKNIKSKAKACFHISSQGELEQVRSVIEKLVQNGDCVELIFTSPSVEDDVRKLKDIYPNLLDILRLPLLSLSIFPFLKLSSWITAPTVCLCRYDFYPELLCLSYSKRMILLNARSVGKGKVYFFIMKFFEVIIAASRDDEQHFRKNKIVPFSTIDFRISRISDRQIKFLKSDNYRSFRNFAARSKKKLVVIGSAWFDDLNFLKSSDFFDLDCHFFIFPHCLDDKTIEEQVNLFKRFSIIRRLEDFDLEQEDEIIPQVFFVIEPGILCDLYPYFDFCYVGGGFGKGVHSVLEPYVGGTSVFCGPKVSRSSEYSFVAGDSPKSISSLKPGFKFSGVYTGEFNLECRGGERARKIEKYSMEQEHLISKFLEIL